MILICEEVDTISKKSSQKISKLSIQEIDLEIVKSYLHELRSFCQKLLDVYNNTCILGVWLTVSNKLLVIDSFIW